jgi:hypothetical protein
MTSDPFHPFCRALRLSASDALATAADLHLVAAGLRLGALLPRFHAEAHLAHLPPHAPPLLLATVPSGSTFLLQAPLLRAKRDALRAALAAGGTPGALEAACRAARAVPPLPVRIDAGGGAPSALPAPALPAWLQRHAALLDGLCGDGDGDAAAAAAAASSPAWAVVARAGAHVALRLAEGDAGPGPGAGRHYCPIALAGLLLDYPIVYDLQGGEGHCLGGCALHVWRAGGAIAFSLPAALAPLPGARDALEQWQALLAARAAAAGLAPLGITCTPENRTHLAI